MIIIPETAILPPALVMRLLLPLVMRLLLFKTSADYIKISMSAFKISEKQQAVQT